MSDLGFSQPDDGSAPIAWAESVQRYGWWRTALIPTTGMVLFAPLLVIPWVGLRFAYGIPALVAWFEGTKRFLAWSMRRPVEQRMDRRDDESGQPPALVGGHRKFRGALLLAQLVRHVRTLGDPLTVAHVRLGSPRFAGADREQERAQRFVDQLVAQPEAKRAVITRSGPQTLSIGFPDLEPDAVELILAAAQTAFAIEDDGSTIAIGTALLEDGETIADVMRRAREASAAKHGGIDEDAAT